LWTGWCRNFKIISVAEQTLDDANHIFVDAEHDGKLPPDKAPEGMSVEDIIVRCRPKNLCDDTGDVYDGQIPRERYALWLYRWAYYAFPDTELRHEALRLTKSHLEEQSWVPPFAAQRSHPAQ